jgi:hypothetical protein
MSLFSFSSSLQFTHIHRLHPPSQYSAFSALLSLLFLSDFPPLSFRPRFNKIRGLLAASFRPRGRHWLTRYRYLVRNGALLLMVFHLLLAVQSVLAPPTIRLCLSLGLLFVRRLPLGKRLSLLPLLLPRLPLILRIWCLGLRSLLVHWRRARFVLSSSLARLDRLLPLQLPR